MTQDDLESISPRDALDWYLDHRRDEVRMATRRKHKSSLGTFVDWIEEVGVGECRNWVAASLCPTRPG